MNLKGYSREDIFALMAYSSEKKYNPEGFLLNLDDVSSLVSLSSHLKEGKALLGNYEELSIESNQVDEFMETYRAEEFQKGFDQEEIRKAQNNLKEKGKIKSGADHTGKIKTEEFGQGDSLSKAEFAKMNMRFKNIGLAGELLDVTFGNTVRESKKVCNREGLASAIKYASVKHSNIARLLSEIVQDMKSCSDIINDENKDNIDKSLDILKNTCKSLVSMLTIIGLSPLEEIESVKTFMENSVLSDAKKSVSLLSSDLSGNIIAKNKYTHRKGAVDTLNKDQEDLSKESEVIYDFQDGVKSILDLSRFICKIESDGGLQNMSFVKSLDILSSQESDMFAKRDAMVALSNDIAAFISNLLPLQASQNVTREGMVELAEFVAVKSTEKGVSSSTVKIAEVALKTGKAVNKFKDSVAKDLVENRELIKKDGTDFAEESIGRFCGI